MTCAFPYISPHINAPVPCGKCFGCRINSRKGWTLRMVLESKYHQFVSFVTLTYSPEALPNPPSVSKIVLQNFFKRLRYYINMPIRYYACGEYGEQSYRPHYHAIVYGPHTSILQMAVDLAWQKGFYMVVPAGPDSMAYVAGYVAKKKEKKDLEARGLNPEFTLSSRRPAIGLSALDEIIKMSENDIDIVSVFNIGNVRYYLPRYLKNKARSKLYNEQYISELTQLFINQEQAKYPKLIALAHAEDSKMLEACYQDMANERWSLIESYKAREAIADIETKLRAKI